MGIKSNNRSESYYNYFGDSGLDAVGAPPPGREVSATGGTKVVNPAGYTTHTFPFVGYGDVFTFNVLKAPNNFEIDYLIMGGGGCGGGPGYGAGGGGAGGYLTQTHFPVPGSATIPITLGRGGQYPTQNGGDSTITMPWLPAPAQAKTAYGGRKGGGWLYPNPVGNAGGSGGGGGCGGPPPYGGFNRGGWGNTAPPTNSAFLAANQTAQGTNGGGGTLHGGPTGYVGGGGGGGACSGAPGNPVDTVPTYSPGRGLTISISGTNTNYCNGGKAGAYGSGTYPSPSTNTGQAVLGSGGNGGGGSAAGREGGDGVCIIRYANEQALSGDTFITATGGDSTIDVGDYRTHLFTSTGPGTFTVNSLAQNPEYNIATVCVIAGGATGGSGTAGGGGGGGVLLNRHFSLSNVAYGVNVGAGGAAKPPSGPGNSGSDSTFTDPNSQTYTALKGGAGGHGGGSSGGTPGGSGGGGTGDYPAGNTNMGYSTATNQGGFTHYGSPGGTTQNNSYGAGGGGAGSNGCDGPMAYHGFEPSPTKGGMGGNAIYIPEFSHPTFPAGGTHPGYYAGGGGGSGPGGSGPPNRSAYGAVGDGAPYRVNTGDGQYAGSTGTGSPGLVMIRYRFQ